MRLALSALLEAIESDLAGIHTPAASRMLARCRKKALLGDTSLQDVALNDFLATNELASCVTVQLPADIISSARDFIFTALCRANEGVQCTLDLQRVLTDWRFGPGATRLLGSKTHFVEKIISPNGSVSDSALPYAKLLRRMNPYLLSIDGRKTYGFRKCNASRMTTVPKNESTDRTICTEPLWNMALQLAFGQSVERALCTLGHDIRSQADINKSLARQGSVSGDLATIDLKSASDLITPELIKTLWPSDCFHFMDTIRSKYTIIRGEEIPLHMMSTMGNGFTFPVMTLTLLALCHAACVFPRNWVPRDRLAVFGDDIIVPTVLAPQVIGVLEQAGLCVNRDKSFVEGSFRESCGGDYDNGVDITPFYVKRLQTDADLYVVANQILDWCSRTGHTMHKTLELVSNACGKKPLIVPAWHNSCEGLLSSEPPSRYRYIKLKPLIKRIKSEKIEPEYQMLIALGGFAEDGGGTFYYSPRVREAPVFEYVKVRTPKGFRGWIGPKGPKEVAREILIDLYFRV